MFEGQRYAYRGVQNDSYAFMNTNTNTIRYFTAEQIAQILGFRPSELLIQNGSQNSIDRVEMVQSMAPSNRNIMNMNMMQSNRNIVQSNRNIAPEEVRFHDRVLLKLVSTDKVNGIYTFQNPNTQEQYEIPI